MARGPWFPDLELDLPPATPEELCPHEQAEQVDVEGRGCPHPLDSEPELGPEQPAHRDQNAKMEYPFDQLRWLARPQAAEVEGHKAQ